MSTTITINEVPVAASRPRVTRFATFYPPKHTEYSNKVKAYLQTLGLTMFTNPISVNITFYIPFPSYSSKTEQSESDGMYGFGKPDIDNLEKMVLDCMNGIAYDDDSLIAKKTTTKQFSKKPRTIVTIKEIPYGTNADKLVQKFIKRRTQAREKKSNKVHI